MSALGEYVHYNWKNYRIYGTSRNETSDFDPLIFSQHRTRVGQKILSMKEIANIDQLEEKYNTGADKLNNFLAESLKAAQKGSANEKKFMQQLLKKINSTWTDETINYILRYLKYDNNKQSFIYDPPVTAKALKEDQNNAIKIMNNLKRKTGIHIETLEDHLQSLLTKAQKLQNGELKNSLIEECTMYLKVLNQGDSGNKELENAVKSITKKSSSSKYKKGFLSYSQENKSGSQGILDQLLNNISSLTSRLTSAVSVQNQIGADMAEYIGTIISKNLNHFTKQGLEKAMKDFVYSSEKTAGSSLTKKQGNGIGSIQFSSSLDQDFLKNTFVFKGKYSNLVTQHKVSDNFSYEIRALEDEVQQKADFVITLEDNSTIGVSMKNTDMSIVSRYENEIESRPNGIKLQDSSLLLYLGGINLDSKKPENLGTHYLQVLSGQRGYENSQYSGEIQRMRRAANEALSLYILWSAATGIGQGRGESSQFAEILAVYDKASSKNKDGFKRIKLYSIRDLLSKLIDPIKLKEYVIFSPSLLDNQLLLTNERVGKEPDPKLADRRITQLLLEARAQNIAVSLSKAYLNQFPNI